MIPRKFLLVALVVALACGCLESEGRKSSQRSPRSKWWQTASLYQIYPRSFKDSDGDGIGDLKGITANMEYLRDIGISATWISPIFTSPMADFGYDISNFTEIDPIYGTMDDFDRLMNKAKRLGLKILLDFVPNHTSDKHVWFKRSANGDPYYKDFYVWHPGRIVKGKRVPPSNWISVFRGAAWTWHKVRKEYYLHQFLKEQPDLNYRNPKVQLAMENIMKFWLKKGVDGFRVDAVKHIYEIDVDAKGHYLDEPRNVNVSDRLDYSYLDHVYTTDRPETVELLKKWKKMFTEFQKKNGGEERILLAESYSSLEVLYEYYGTEDEKGANFPFNFNLLDIKNDSLAIDYVTPIKNWLKSIPPGATANWLIGNHDKSRVGSRMGIERIDGMNLMVAALPGVCITYQGEEIGMTDVPISWSDTKDPQGCNTNPDIYTQFSRDPVRSPFQWNNDKNAGFSQGPTTWLPVADNYKTINVESELLRKNSHLDLFKQFQLLRREKTYRFGKTDVQAFGPHIVVIKRSLDNEYTYINIVNTKNKIQFIDLSDWSPELRDLQYVVVNRKSQHHVDDIISAGSILLMPWECCVLRSKDIIRHRIY